MSGLRIPTDSTVPAPKGTPPQRTAAQEPPQGLNQAPGPGTPRQGVSSPGSIEAPKSTPIPGGILFPQTAEALGFPKDALSTILLSFIRFFSLSPSHLGTLRREVLASYPGDQTGQEKNALEGKALAALLSLDKGVRLSPQALERYAGLLSFFGRERSGPSPSGQTDPAIKITLRGSPARQDEENVDSLDPNKIKAIAGDLEDQDDFLQLMNSFPGKNGQRWLALPLELTIDEIDLTLVLRILTANPAAPDDLYMIADIQGPHRQWRWKLEKKGETHRVEVQVYPELEPPQCKLLTQQVEELLGPGDHWTGSFQGFREIKIQNGGDPPSFADDLINQSFSQVDKEV